MSARENERRRFERALLSVWDRADDYARTYGASWYADALNECAAITLDTPRDFQAAVWLALRALTRDGNAGGGGWARVAAGASL